MTLLDRIARNGVDRENQVSGHRVENAFKLYCHGKVGRNTMINFFNIPTEMESDFDQFKDTYNAFGTDLDREKWLMDLEACIVALQMGDITKTNFNNLLGLSLDES